MSSTVRPVPEGYSSVTPYLIIRGVAKAIEFYQQAFGAKERMRFEVGGEIGHAEIEIGDSLVMMGDEGSGAECRGPESFGGSPVGIHLYVEDVDATVERAVAHGAQVVRPVQNQFYGDRSGTVRDPFGHIWNIATHIEDLSPEELRRRADEMFGTK